MAYGVTVVLGGLVLVAVAQAHGQVVDSGILGGADEKTRELLHFLHDIGHGEGYGLGEMLRYFNAAVLVFVAVILIYHMFYAVVETGRSGEAALTGWQVMRLVICVGLIFPLPATGLGPGQHLFLGLTDVSGNVAAGVWGRFANLIAGGGPGGPVRAPPQYRDVVVKMIIIHTCMHVHNQVAAQADDGPYITVNREEHADRVIYRYRDPENEIRYPACGLVSIPVESDADNAAARIMTVAHLNTLTSPAFVAGLDQAATDLGDRFIRDNEKLGDSLPEVEEWLDGTGLVQLYDDTMLDQVAKAAEESRDALTNEVAAAIAREGWLSAASFLMVVSRNQAMLHDALRAVPTVTIAHFGTNMLLPAVNPWREAQITLNQWLTTSQVVEESPRLAPGNEEGWWSKLLKVIPVDSVAYLDDGSPLESLVGMGHKMVTGALVLLVGDAVLSVASRAYRSIANLVLGDTMETIRGLARTVAYVLLLSGVLLAYILPLIPFLRFFFGVVSWVISVVVGLIALPLFLAVHIGGEEERGLLSAASRGGYLLVLHAVVRPALMVLGLVFGYFVFVTAIDLFNWLFAAHLEGISNSETVGVITAIVSFVAYSVVAVGIANASFKAIDIVPQEVMHWLGGRARIEDDEVAGMARTIGETVTVSAVLRSAGRFPRAK